MKLLIKLRTALALGLLNIARVTAYRLGVKLRLNPVCHLRATPPRGPFFSIKTLKQSTAAPLADWQASGQLFGRWPFTVGAQAPDWLASPFTGQRVPNPQRNWWTIPDFDPVTGDIKVIWELSRMDWVLAFAQRAHNRDAEALTRLNTWLADWCENNTPYRGPNWKCGQEASFRVMHLAMAALILDQVNTATSDLRELVHLHLQRIAPTVQYAVGQDNNHGTSEAAALFIGGVGLPPTGRRRERSGNRRAKSGWKTGAPDSLGRTGGSANTR